MQLEGLPGGKEEVLQDVSADGPRLARDRLHRLYELRVLEPFRPRRDTGSCPFHYVLDVGAWIAAAYHGVDPSSLVRSDVRP